MYLKEPEVRALLDEVTALSAPGSYMILNYLNGPGSPADIGYMSESLRGQGWGNEKDRHWGQEDFNFGRFPEGEESLKNMGFAFYDKE